MKEVLEQFSVYNHWANERLLATINTLPEEKLIASLPSSFTTIHQTLLHMWDAETVWWQRIKFVENVIKPSNTFTGETRDAGEALLHQNILWKNWIAAARPVALDHVLLYKNNRKDQFKQPVFQILIHMFNHGTYHRGQIVNMLHQVNVTAIPATDFIVWSRGKK